MNYKYDVSLREKGMKLLEQLDEPVMNLHRTLVGHLTRSELKELSRLLEKCRTSVSDE